jgi:ribosomal protein S6--L-glutamate ligase
MDICLIMDNPETPQHPVIAVALQELSTRHSVRLLDVRNLSGEQALQEEARHPRADLYLLKSHAPQALEVAHALEQKGALVVNSWASSVACQDRVLMAQRMHEAHLPWPQTWHYATLADLLADKNFLATLAYPVIIKSYYSHRGDLVDFVRSYEELEKLAAEWSRESIVLQEYAESDGWDIKMWVIDRQIFAARRRTPLEPDAPKEDFVIAPEDLPQEWANITREIGRVFNLRLYGVDLLVTNRGPMIVDVNSFPGFRGVPGADSALVELVEKLGREQPGRPQGSPLPYNKEPLR